MKIERKGFDDLDRAIIKSFAKNNMSIKETAKDVFASRSGVDLRLRRIYALTGLNPKNFYELIKLLEVCEEWKNDGGKNDE